MVVEKTRADLAAGLVLIGLGIFIIFQATKLDYSSEYGPGPGFLPLWLGIGFVVLASALLWNSRGPTDKDSKALWSEAKRALTAWAALIVGMALLKRIGFVLSFTLLSIFLVWAVDRRSPLTAMVVAICSALGFYLIFSVALGLPLPQGPWGFF
jgi:putative tricarboxylic transport membrane protein